jgi:tetratricopeptide (TPR) repeat protein
VSFRRIPIILFLCGTAVSARADRNNRFYIKPYGHFYSNAVAYCAKGSELLEKGDLQGACQCFDSAIAIDNHIWPAYLDRAVVYYDLGKWQLALRDCNTAARLQPAFFRTFIIRADIYHALGRCREGLADLDRVILLHANDETDALALNDRALLHAICRDRSVHDPKKALADATRACKIEHYHMARYVSTLGTAYAVNGDFDSAVRYEQQAIDSGRLTDQELRIARERLSRYQHHQAP